MTETLPPLSELNRTRPFDPQRYMLKLKGKDYLPVAARVAWFREQHPIASGWGIHTEPIAGGREAGCATYRASIVDPEGRVVATATKTEDKAGFADYEEKAETGAIGRALALCGFGTLFALELEEGEEPIADSPVERARMTEKAPPAPAPAIGREAIEEKYAQWLEKAASLGAMQSYPREFQFFRTFDPSGAMPEKLKDMCKGLKALVNSLEAEATEYQEARLDLAMDAAAEAEPDPFEAQKR